MTIPTPKEVFDNPAEFLDFLQSSDFEGQHFDRKEIRTDSGSQINKVKEEIRQCISAFANQNREGGLLVLGIDNDGQIKGAKHVTQAILDEILQYIDQALRHHVTHRKVLSCKNENNQDDKIHPPIHSLDSRCNLRNNRFVPQGMETCRI